jgi:hypothetical protein
MTRREDFHGSVGIEKPIAVRRVGIFTVQDHCHQKAGNQIKIWTARFPGKIQCAENPNMPAM